MISALALLVTLTSLVTALHVSVSAGTARYRWSRAVPHLVVVQLLVLVLAVGDAVGLAAGHRPAQLSTHLAYLVVAVAVVPVAALYSRGADGRWAGALVAAALVVLAVLVVRLQATSHALG